MQEIKISVIVPCYNVEKLLPRCLDSLVGQTMENIEIICVNDASPDNGIKILREYESRYNNIRVVDLKENVCLRGAGRPDSGGPQGKRRPEQRPERRN